MTQPISETVATPAPGSSPRRRRRPISVVWLLVLAAVLVAALGVVSMVWKAPGGAFALSAAAALLLVLGIVATMRREARVRHAAAYRGELEYALGRLEAELLPRAMEQLHRGEPVEHVLAGLAPPVPCGQVTAAVHALVARVIQQSVELGQGRLESAKRSFVALAQRVQGEINRKLATLSDLERKYSEEPEILAELFALDHSTAQSGRLVGSIVVLGGARPAKRWPDPVPLLSVLRGAASRIAEYRRVAIQLVPTVDIDGPAVEALIHALAELLDNATRFSPPQTSVYVTAAEVHKGVVVEIADGGVGMPDEEARRAAHLLSGEHELDLEDLGESPRLGLAVAGRLCALIGASVELHDSVYGGVRVVLFIPKDRLRAAADPDEAPLVVSPRRSAARKAQGPAASQVVGATAGGLPKRRRRSTPVTPNPMPRPASAPVEETKPVDPRARHAFLGAMQRASRAIDSSAASASALGPLSPTDEQGHTR